MGTQQSEAENGGNTLRILIAEDEPRAMRGLKNLITSISPDYQVVAEAADGRQALEMLQQQKPEVVFTDLKMPYMDGMALIRTAHALESTAEFVLVTAYEEFEVAREAIGLGVFDYLVKPITIEDVMRVLERLSTKLGGTQEHMAEMSLRDQYPEAHPLVRKTLHIIEESYASKLNQKELAQMLGISQEYLCYLFNKDVGEPFVKFVKKYRIETAKRLLASGRTTKDEVAYQVGFSDAKYFGRVFREVAGVSVAEYVREM